MCVLFNMRIFVVVDKATISSTLDAEDYSTHPEKVDIGWCCGVSENGKTDLRVVKTRNAIKNALKDMMCEMDESEITVKELTERAQIHRKTFYLHYGSIEDLLEEVLHDFADGYSKMMMDVPADASFRETNRVFFTYMAEQEPFIERIVCSDGSHVFATRLFMSMLVNNRSRHNPYSRFPEDEQNIINTFLATTSVNIYKQWVADGKRIPLERLIELSGNLFTNGISSVLADGCADRGQ